MIFAYKHVIIILVFLSLLRLVYNDGDNISLRFLFLLKTVQMEFSENMFLRLLSECKMGRCFLIKLLILGNIGLYVVANKI